jgi:hypothetical protein
MCSQAKGSYSEENNAVLFETPLCLLGATPHTSCCAGHISFSVALYLIANTATAMRQLANFHLFATYVPVVVDIDSFDTGI